MIEAACSCTLTLCTSFLCSPRYPSRSSLLPITSRIHRIPRGNLNRREGLTPVEEVIQKSLTQGNCNLKLETISPGLGEIFHFKEKRIPWLGPEAANAYRNFDGA